MNRHLQTAIFIALLFLLKNAFGQTSEDPGTKTYLDPVINLMSTNLNYGNSNSALSKYKKSLLGGQLGISFQGGITPSFSVVSELYFSAKGGKLKTGNPLTLSKSTLRVYAIELPLLARFHLRSFHINAGPSIAYNFHGNRKTEGMEDDFSFSKDRDGFRRLEVGIQTGGGYTFHTKRKRITLDLRYNYGLTNVSYDQQIHNRSFVASVHISKPWKNNPLAKERYAL